MDAENKAEVRQESSIGAILKNIREKRGLTVEQVADKLKLKNSTLIALEKDDYRNLGGMVYIKGYLRSYAKLLDMDIEERLHALDGDVIQMPKKDREASSPFQEDSEGNKTGLWVIIAVILAVILIAFFWHQHKKQKALAAEAAVTPAVTNTGVSTQSVIIPTVVTNKTMEIQKPAANVPKETPNTDPTLTSKTPIQSANNATAKPAAATKSVAESTTIAPKADAKVSGSDFDKLTKAEASKPAEAKEEVLSKKADGTVVKEDKTDDVITVSNESADAENNKNEE